MRTNLTNPDRCKEGDTKVNLSSEVLTVFRVEAAEISDDRALRTSTRIEPAKINKIRAETQILNFGENTLI